MSRADFMTMESKRLRWSLSPPLWVLEAYSLLIDTARIRLASAFTSIAVVALIVAYMRNYARLFWHLDKTLTELTGFICPELDLSF